MFTIRNIKDLVRWNTLEDYSDISRVTVEGFENIATEGGFNLGELSEDQGVILEFVDCQYPLETLLDNLNLQEGSVTTLVYRFTREYQKPNLPIRCSRPLPFERLVIDFGARLDAKDLDVQNLVLYNMLSVYNLNDAKNISNLTVVHSFNPVDDAEISPREGFDIPNPRGLTTLVIPEAQEFKYELGKTAIPDVIGILQSSFYPSRLAIGLQQSREPLSRSNLPDIVYEVFSRTHA
jgi:hypothetical protein